MVKSWVCVLGRSRGLYRERPPSSLLPHCKKTQVAAQTKTAWAPPPSLLSEGCDSKSCPGRLVCHITVKLLGGLIADAMDRGGLGARPRSTAGTSASDTSKALRALVAPIRSHHLVHAEGEAAVSVAGWLYRKAGDCV